MLVHKMPKPSNKNKHVSTIPAQSTFISLVIPRNLVCSICHATLDPLVHRKNKRKEEKCKSERKKCKQLWDIVMQTKDRLTDGEIKNIRLQCRYLRLEYPNMNEFNAKTNCYVLNMLDHNDKTFKTHISTHGNSQIYTSNVRQSRTNNTQE